MQGILSDAAIKNAISSGYIEITPYNPEHINPCSIDLTLGDGIAVYSNWVETWKNEHQPKVQDGSRFISVDCELDVKKEPEVLNFKIDPDEGWLFKPGIGYLAHTKERIRTSKYVPVLDGKSSIGRLFLKIHETAGLGDVGFDGQYTLEITVQHPIRVYPGMRIAQMRFLTIEGEVLHSYAQVGNYTGKSATGAVGSKAWKQFSK